MESISCEKFYNYKANDGSYCGFIVYDCRDDEELARFYETANDNPLGLLVNQYCILTQNKTIVDMVVWDGEHIEHAGFKNINNDYLGKIKPRNIHQELAFNLLQNDDITIKVLTGGFGCGKDFLMVSHAIDMIRHHKFDKIVWVRNNIEVHNTNPIGFLPDGLKEKLLPFALPLADHLGGVTGLEIFMNQGKIEIQHLGFIRGRDIKNSIIYCSEAENMTKEHIQLLIGRVGEGSSLWLNGDFKQVDGEVFRHNNGLDILIERLKGNKHFGIVKLMKTERSETAALADLLD